MYLHPLANSLDNRSEGGDGRGCAIELTAAVIGDNDGVDASLRCGTCVLNIHHTLEDQPTWPSIAHPLHVPPREARVELLRDPRGERRQIAHALGMTHYVAKRPALSAKHAYTPLRSGDELAYRVRVDLWRRRQAIPDVIVPLP
eukprot:CAMPEP_0115862542 /NCGR_PEP_ID=MMETSP0287-20121206/18228_1 /TAXON_ID=412157 /ORGANISM="Chrysochromulina rotalis, Strain UIO044" /LENGTH=143 /DNA_ID=CAMNT_0003316963 /DNA_START=484 /DNA_END=915 /DNA_ORIENTATION=-